MQHVFQENKKVLRKLKTNSRILTALQKTWKHASKKVPLKLCWYGNWREIPPK